MDTHGRDIIDKLQTQNVRKPDEFQWQSQLKFYWDATKNDARINICDAQFWYSYEYLGNGPRLVVTPLTDRTLFAFSQFLLKVSTSQQRRPCIWRWDAPRLDLREPGKPKPPRIWPTEWQRLATSSIAPEKWVTKLWEISSRGWPAVGAGGALMSSIGWSQKCCRSVRFSSSAWRMQSSRPSRDSRSREMKSVWIPPAECSLRWTLGIWAVRSCRRAWRPCSGQSRWLSPTWSWFARTCWWQRDSFTPRFWPKSLSLCTSCARTCCQNPIITIGDWGQ